MAAARLLLIGDHFIPSELMRRQLGTLAQRFEIVEARTPFPLEPYSSVAEVREASGTEEQMIRELAGVSLCIAHHAPLTERVMQQSPELKLFIVCRGGPVNVNVSAATAHGITVGYTPARNAVATAEHTIGMMLSALRGIPAADAEMRQGRWRGDYTYQTAGFELGSATVGLIGYGAIGKIVARILHGFGSEVLVYDPFAPPRPEDRVAVVSLPELLERSQVVSLHARETAASRGMIGRAEIARMPQGAVIVNCARGALLDYDAVAAALESKHLFAAAADVFATEPLSTETPLLRLPNFILTPHLAGGTREAAEKAAEIAAEELRRYIAGESLRFCANPELAASAV